MILNDDKILRIAWREYRAKAFLGLILEAGRKK
jgi:hypothetical protein